MIDIFGIALLIIGTVAYFLSKKKRAWLFVATLGLGIEIGSFFTTLQFLGAFAR